MAEGKNSFLLYTDIIHTVRKLPKEKAGELFLHILEYVNDLDPVTDDFAVEIAFEPIKQNLKRNLKSYKDKVQKNSESGRIGNLKKWHPDLYEKYSSDEVTLEECEKIIKDRKRDKNTAKNRERDKTIANIADNVNDNDNDNDILLEKETKGVLSFPSENFEEKNIPPKKPESEKEKSSAKKEKDIINYFNEKCKSLPKVKILTEPRKKKIAARIKEFGIDKVLSVIDETNDSRFLNGENNQNWQASFDWLIEPKNFTKILEGNYKNKNNESRKTTASAGPQRNR
ncbi:DUF6291 domain-containing protein [Chryseobacterium gambrini]|uniref:DUF6291 domain-containing protein n=1 Tax=Chryseobacterium gambrini TaxID=373672 RepID=UPI003D0AB771